MDLVTDDMNPNILNDAHELRYYDAKNEAKISNKKSISLKFHDGALAGNKLHATLLYERGYWYLQDHSTYGTFIYPRTVIDMKNHKESSRIKLLNNMKISVGGHMLQFTVDYQKF
jgi:hypothetical protein